LDGSDVAVNLKLEHRRKGLLWYSTYHVSFVGKYKMVNHSSEAQEMVVDFRFPTEQAVYDNFCFAVNGQEVNEVEINAGNLVRIIPMNPGETKQVDIAYESQGLDEWNYDFGANVKQVRNFSLILNTDFEEVDFPQQSISPTAKEKTSDGWKLTWKYKNLLTGVKIGMIMPKKLNPGPWVTEVTVAAPVSLFLFFFLLFVCTTVQNIKIHPMNYFFIGAAFFSFHLLLAYLVDHISIHMAFWICSAVSIALVVSYMRLVVGSRFAFVEVALFQLVYLILFSYTFFFAGYTGLAITVLCICTLFVVMLFTGRVDWEKVFTKTPEK
jgi:inner membrane protein involved in colicin E2 resistance